MKIKLTTELGLDKSLFQQFLTYLANLCRFYFGFSFYYGETVSSLILSYLPWTLILVITSMIFSIIIEFITGIECRFKHDRYLDLSILSGMMLLNGMPHFFIGMMLIIFFSGYLGWLPMHGYE